MWFEVDKDGLSKLLSRKGKSFVLLELLQNAWDAVESDTNNKERLVQLEVQPIPGKPFCEITVKDDHPDGFLDLKNAFTLFADNEKRSNPVQRGRFNLGEKLVLSLCESAVIRSTTGTIHFEKNGRRKSKEKTTKGTEFSGIVRITRDEIEAAIKTTRSVIVPKNVTTLINGSVIPERKIVAEFESILPTEIADDEGFLRRTNRKTKIQIIEPVADEKASIYEMGIPAVETGDYYHINVLQKLPLNIDRDNVPPSYLQTLRVLVLNTIYDLLPDESSNDDWVRAATSDKRCSDQAVNKMLTARFGEKRASYDPSDPESNMKVVSMGYTLIKGRQLSSGEWENARRAGCISSAGKIAPCRPNFNGTAREINITDLPQNVADVMVYTEKLGYSLMNVRVKVIMLDAEGYSAVYEKKDENNAVFVYYYETLGPGWFKLGSLEVDELIIHEFGHQYSNNHLSSEYHNALCSLGSKMKFLALSNPDFFNENNFEIKDKHV